MFLLKHFIQRGYECSGVTSGSSLIMLRVLRGRNQWIFCDSYWTLRAPLAEIGKSLGMPKGSCEFDAPIAELTTYNEQDCRILFAALKRLEDELWELGGELKITLASSAMTLFRRAYLEDELVVPRQVNERIREGYKGGRVEVYQRHVAKPGFYYDMNSCYPHAMTYDLPGNYLGYGTKITKFSWVDATVNTTGYCPALPYQSDALYFPTGKFRGTFYAGELDQRGVDILEVHRVYKFDGQSYMAPFVDDLYSRRKATKDEFKRLVYKLLMNSLYGKLGERRDKEKLVINPSEEWLRNGRILWREAKKLGLPSPVQMLIPHVFIESVDADIGHEHVPLCAAVTATARKNLRGHMLGTETLYYCDTDGFGTTTPDLPVSPELGDLKLEKTFDSAEFVAPKIYRLDNMVAAKGFPRKAIAEKIIYQNLIDLSEDRPPSVDSSLLATIMGEVEGSDKHPFDASATLRRDYFARIAKGETLEYRSMDRAASQLSNPTGPEVMMANGDVQRLPEAREARRTKQFRNIARAKRYETPDGNTRAWDILELEHEPA